MLIRATKLYGYGSNVNYPDPTKHDPMIFENGLFLKCGPTQNTLEEANAFARATFIKCYPKYAKRLKENA